MSQLGLFGDGERPEQASRLTGKLRTLSVWGVYVGMSSWKYEDGWGRWIDNPTSRRENVHRCQTLALIVARPRIVVCTTFKPRCEMPETVVHFQIRMPPLMHEQLASRARDEKSSLNLLIVALLKDAWERRNGNGTATTTS